MDKHRIRMTNLPDDPIPVLWIEFEKDSWIDVNINLTADDNLHELLHEFITPQMEFGMNKSIPLSYHTRAFNLYELMRDYQEEIIE